MHHVIIGNSAAGVKAAETIREVDAGAVITIISEETAPAYSRCLLPNYLSGARQEGDLAFRSRAFYALKQIGTMLGVRAERVRPETKVVELSDGRKVPYDKLLIATGSSTAFPPVPGLEGAEVFGLRNLADARGILAMLPTVRRAVIIGAGLVGLETAYALYHRGIEVTIVERLPQVLPQQFDARAAAILQRDMQAEGIRFVLGWGIKEVVDSSVWQRVFERRGKGVILEDGDHLKAELVVVATGTRTNVSLVLDTGMQIDRGIVVDRYMQTSIPDIYAAGDVAETVDALTGLRGLSPIWPNAVSQGKVAGYNMAGVRRTYSPLIGMQNAVEFRAVPAIAVGVTQPIGDGFETMTLYRPERNLYKKLVLKDNVLVGMILVGDIARAGVYAAVMKKRVDVTPFKHKLIRGDFSCAELLHHSA